MPYSNVLCIFIKYDFPLDDRHTALAANMCSEQKYCSLFPLKIAFTR